MRAVLQRVTRASVEVDGRVVASIGPGLLCLVGCAQGDADEDAEYICRKILECRLFPDEDSGRAWSRGVRACGLEVLLVSQFTLHAQLKGHKPDFHRAMPPQEASTFYAGFVERVRRSYVPDRVSDGIFGAMMRVQLENDGPVTLCLDSRA